MFVRKMLARALPLTALGLAAWCPVYAVEEPGYGKIRKIYAAGGVQTVSAAMDEAFRTRAFTYFGAWCKTSRPVKRSVGLCWK